MARFTDANGRTWTVTITITEIKRLRDELGLDLLDFSGDQLFVRLIDDPVLIVDVLHCVLREECAARECDADAFAHGLRGDALDAASQALLEAIVDFFPSRRRTVLQAALTKTEHWMDSRANHALEMIQSEALDQMLAKELEGLTQDVFQTSGE